MKSYNITLLRGDGIGPEIVAEAVRVLDAAGEKFGYKLHYTDALMGGCAIDATGVPLPKETVDTCLASDAVLLGAVLLIPPLEPLFQVAPLSAGMVGTIVGLAAGSMVVIQLLKAIRTRGEK